MITRCYLEITNICNLDCVFCPKTNRKKKKMTLEEFEILTERLRGQIKFLYFHLMGEPLLHPLLTDFIRKARQKQLIPVLTTNGTLLDQRMDLLDALPHKIQISLHSHEGNGRTHLTEYLGKVMPFAIKAAQNKCIVVLRLWNHGGYDSMNEEILRQIATFCPQPWHARKDGWKLADHLYIENDQMFDWPDLQQEIYQEQQIFCYALRNQIGVLADGTVVPCCLDHVGNLNLGNLFEQSLEDILSTSRAQAIYQGFTSHTAIEPLCQRCGYAAVSKQYRK